MEDINWTDVGSMARDVRDGRHVLLAVANHLGTMDGGDGAALHPETPYIFYVAKWDGDRWLTTETGAMYGDPITLEAHEPIYFAEINWPA